MIFHRDVCCYQLNRVLCVARTFWKTWSFWEPRALVKSSPSWTMCLIADPKDKWCQQDALCISWTYGTSWTLIELILQVLCYCFCQCSHCQTRCNCNHISMRCWRIQQVWQSPDSYISPHLTCLHTAPSWLPVIQDGRHSWLGFLRSRHSPGLKYLYPWGSCGQICNQSTSEIQARWESWILRCPEKSICLYQAINEKK